jgi:hypothetical protein
MSASRLGSDKPIKLEPEVPQGRGTHVSEGTWLLAHGLGGMALIVASLSDAGGWDVLAAVGFAVGLPPMLLYLGLRGREKRLRR